MELEISCGHDCAAVPRTTLRVAGFVDLSTSETLLDAGLKILWSDPYLALDLSAVDFMDAAGVATLTALDSAALRLGATFEIVAVSRAVYRVLRILQLTDRWSVPRPGDLPSARS